MYPKAFLFKFPNSAVDCYLTLIRSSDLKKWRQDDKLRIEYLRIVTGIDGKKIERYQRSKEARRINKIKRFLDVNGTDSVIPPILPQNVVLNARKEFDQKMGNDGLYLIPNDVKFSVVDGQHRIEALIEHPADLTIPATITVGLNQQEEGALFLLINHTQKKVPATIRLLDIAGMRKSQPMKKLEPLLQAIGFGRTDLKTLDLASEQVLKKGHFWFDKVRVPEGEE
jgi:DGQHR domain-containing protein